MPDVGDALGWSDSDLDALSDIGDRDVQRARQWNARYMPPPMQRLNEAPAADTEDDARRQVADNA